MNLPRHLSRELIDSLLQRVSLDSAHSHGAMPLTAPFTGDTIAEVPRCTPDDVAQAARRARAAQKSWRETSIADRARVFSRLHDLVLDRQEQLLDLIQLESGKARRHAFEEVLDTAICCRYSARAARRHLRSESRQGALPFLTRTRVNHLPLGLVGFIAPWNYPLSLAVTDAIPALLMGNAALLKPDQKTPLTALFVAALLEEAGLPADLFQVVTGEGRELGIPLLDAVDGVTFTGSSQTGAIIARQAGERLIGASLELGGKNAMIVRRDADLDRAVQGALVGCFANAGQLCISIERIFVHAAIADDFTRRLAQGVNAMRLCASFDDDADMGSLVSAAQLDKVQRHVRDALEKGARLIAGGHARADLGPFFHEPTVLEGVDSSMEVYAEETFGPLASIYRFDSDEEAIERANDSIYGLNASLWTRDTRRALDMARRVEAGTVNINEPYAAAWASADAPMGGFKASGLGRRHGREGFLKYTQAQTVAVQRLMPVSQRVGGDGTRYRRWMSRAIALLKWLPGID